MGIQKKRVKIDISLKPLIPSYINDILKWIEDIKNDADASDFESIRKLSHNMSGSGSGYGLDFITESGLKINRAAHERDVAGIKELCMALYDYLKNIDIEYIEVDDDFFFEEDE